MCYTCIHYYFAPKLEKSKDVNSIVNNFGETNMASFDKICQCDTCIKPALATNLTFGYCLKKCSLGFPIYLCISHIYIKSSQPTDFQKAPLEIQWSLIATPIIIPFSQSGHSREALSMIVHFTYH